MPALVVAHTPITSRVYDIPSPLSVSSIWVRVRVSVRRCCRFSGLYAFHSSDSAAVGIPRRMIAVLMSYQAPASSTGASLQWIGRWVCRIRSKSASRMTLEDGIRRGVGPRLLVLVGMSAGVGVFRSTHSLGARLNTASDYPLHHSRCSKLTNSIESFLVSADQRFSFLRYFVILQSLYYWPGSKSKLRNRSSTSKMPINELSEV